MPRAVASFVVRHLLLAIHLHAMFSTFAPMLTCLHASLFVPRAARGGGTFVYSIECYSPEVDGSNDITSTPQTLSCFIAPHKSTNSMDQHLERCFYDLTLAAILPGVFIEARVFSTRLPIFLAPQLSPVAFPGKSKQRH